MGNDTKEGCQKIFNLMNAIVAFLASLIVIYTFITGQKYLNLNLSHPSISLPAIHLDFHPTWPKFGLNLLSTWVAWIVIGIVLGFIIGGIEDEWISVDEDYFYYSFAGLVGASIFGFLASALFPNIWGGFITDAFISCIGCSLFCWMRYLIWDTF